MVIGSTKKKYIYHNKKHIPYMVTKYSFFAVFHFEFIYYNTKKILWCTERSKECVPKRVLS